MTVGRFTSARNLAARLILKNGEKSTHVRVSKTKSLTQPWRHSGVSEERTTVDAAWFEFDTDRIDEDLVRTGDREVLVPATALPVVPDSTTDYMERIDGTRWQVISNRTIQPNEDLILHTMQVRQT